MNFKPLITYFIVAFFFILILGFFYFTSAQNINNGQNNPIPSIPGQNPPVFNQNPPIPGQNPPLPVPPSPPPPGTGAPPPPSPNPSQIIAYKVINENLQKAIESAKAVKQLLTAGELWMMRAPAGEIEIKGALMYQNYVIGVIKFHPVNGEPLIMGYNPRIFGNNIQIHYQDLKAKLMSIIKELKVVECAEYIEPESSFIFPLSFNGEIISKIKIYVDGVHVMPDYPATQEMQMYAHNF